VEVVTSVVKKLGGFIIEANVSEKTTHVVTQGPRSTVNLLKGIARGCWIVLQEWVLKSLDADAWLEEDEFELTGFSPAVRVIIFLCVMYYNCNKLFQHANTLFIIMNCFAVSCTSG
jgi:microcephalin